MTPRQADMLRSEALSWLGTPFHHAAAVKGAGVDCVRFIIEVLAACGLIERFVPDTYATDWCTHEGPELWLEGVGKQCRKVQPPYQVGDILLLRWGRQVGHAALCIGQGQVVAGGPGEVSLHRLDSPALTKRLHSAWRLK